MRVAAPGPAGVDDLAGVAGLVEAERIGDDRRRGLQPSCRRPETLASLSGIPSSRSRFPAVG